LLCAVLAPAFAAVAAMPHTTILAVYGKEWEAATVLITPLALAMPVNAMLALGGPMMQGLGRAGLDAASQGVALIVLVIAVVAAASISLEAVAWVVLGVNVLRAWLVTRLATELVNASASALLRALAGPFLLSILAAALAAAVDWGLASLLPQFGTRFVFALGICAAVVLLAIGVSGRWLFCTEAKMLLNKVQVHLPRSFRGVHKIWGET